MNQILDRFRRPLLAVVACALLVVVLAVSVDDGPMEVVAEFDDSAGLFEGNDIGIRGVKVGEITDIRPTGSTVEVRFRLDRGIGVPASAGAVVVSRSVATDRYVELTPVDGDGPRMVDGARIPLERTRTPVEFDEVLASLGEFSEGMLGKDAKGASLRALLAEGAEALNGRGQGINQTVREFAKAAGVLSDHRGDLVGTVKELDALVALISTNRHVVDRFVTSISDATDLFADESENFGESLTALSRALGSLASFVETHQEQLSGSLGGLTRVTESILERQAELKETVEVLPLTLENLGNAIDQSRRLDVKLPPQYLSSQPAVTEPICEALPAICNELGTDPNLLDLIRTLTGGN